MSQRYGIVGFFEQPGSVVACAREAVARGFRGLEAYTPQPVEELEEVLEIPSTRLPLLTLVAGLLGGLFGVVLQYWTSAVDYPLNVGGRPLNSWPAFIPIAFECAILAAGIATVVGMLAANGLPRPHHPVLGTTGFDAVSTDRFALCVRGAKGRDADEWRAILREHGATHVEDIFDA